MAVVLLLRWSLSVSVKRRKRSGLTQWLRHERTSLSTWSYCYSSTTPTYLLIYFLWIEKNNARQNQSCLESPSFETVHSRDVLGLNSKTFPPSMSVVFQIQCWLLTRHNKTSREIFTNTSSHNKTYLHLCCVLWARCDFSRWYVP